MMKIVVGPKIMRHKLLRNSLKFHEINLIDCKSQDSIIFAEITRVY